MKANGTRRLVRERWLFDALDGTGEVVETIEVRQEDGPRRWLVLEGDTGPPVAAFPSIEKTLAVQFAHRLAASYASAKVPRPEVPPRAIP